MMEMVYVFLPCLQRLDTHTQGYDLPIPLLDSRLGRFLYV